MYITRQTYMLTLYNSYLKCWIKLQKSLTSSSRAKRCNKICNLFQLILQEFFFVSLSLDYLQLLKSCSLISFVILFFSLFFLLQSPFYLYSPSSICICSVPTQEFYVVSNLIMHACICKHITLLLITLFMMIKIKMKKKSVRICVFMREWMSEWVSEYNLYISSTFLCELICLSIFNWRAWEIFHMFKYDTVDGMHWKNVELWVNY